jgi:hypothetical protein
MSFISEEEGVEKVGLSGEERSWCERARRG